MLAPDEAALATCEAAWVRLAALSVPEASWMHDSLTDCLRTGEGVDEDILRKNRDGGMRVCAGECLERAVTVRVAVRSERGIRIVVGCNDEERFWRCRTYSGVGRWKPLQVDWNRLHAEEQFKGSSVSEIKY